LRTWLSAVKLRTDLLLAASHDPTIILPKVTYTFMVVKGIFSSQDEETPLKWLERLLKILCDAYLRTVKSLSGKCRDWDKLSTVDFLANDARKKVFQEVLVNLLGEV
jgi:hypothetical protein